MKTKNMTYAGLWKLHHADPSNHAIREEITLRDGGRTDWQLWPIRKLSTDSVKSDTIHKLEREVTRLNTLVRR